MNYFAIGAISACIVILLGAFGAHGLKEKLESLQTVEIYKTAVLYHMIHSMALFIVNSLKTDHAGYFFLAGIIFFSGSLYLLSITGIKWLGAITPIGGVCFLIGWLLILFTK